MTATCLRRGLCATFFAALLTLASCGGGGSGDATVVATPPAAAASGAISGTVVAASTGNALSGVAVKVGALSASTAADGSYTLNGVPVGDGKVVSFEVAGHAKGVFTVSVATGATVRADARLTPIGATQTIDAASAATVTVAGSAAQVSLPAAGLVTAAGVVASGAVKVELTAIDPAANPANMPGNYTAQAAGGTTQRIESFGALKVTLTDSAGAALNLAAGKTATLRIPLSSRSTSPPASVPLFYLNESTGLWVQEGSATLAGTVPNQYYEGTVSHFTFWNADQVTDTIRVLGCVQDGSGVRVANAQVTSVGSDYIGSNIATTDANGQFTVFIRKASVATIFGQLGVRGTNAVRVGPSDTDITLTTCLVLSAGGTAPQIVRQPQSLNIEFSGLAILSVEATGSPELRYQWKRNGVDIAGATGSYYFAYPLQAADSGTSFSVVVSNPYGSVTSDAAVVTLSAASQPPSITGQPLSKTVTVGATATFDVTVALQGGTLSYQWRRNGVAISGATGSSYTTPATVAADNGAGFSVLVSSSNGTSVLSSTALLSVVVPSPLAITAQPQNVSINVGQSAIFSVSATGGSAGISYQWQRNGTPISGATAVSYATPATVLADNGAAYRVVVSSAAESVTSAAATLTVSQPVGANGYYLLASAGPQVAGTITFANGVQTTQTQALLAVNSSAPASGAVTIEPAGQATPVFVGALQGTVASGQVSNLRSRLGAYFKGGRLYKLDQVVANGTQPTPQLLSSLASSDVCGNSGYVTAAIQAQGSDLANPLRSWAFLQGPGGDGQCNNADDVYRAVRFDMAATDAALTVAEPQVDILGADGSFGGLVVRNGTQMQRVDANLGNASNLFTIATSGYRNLGVSFGSAAPGVWLFIEGGKLWGVNLGAPATRVQLAALTGNEGSSPAVVSDGGTAFVGLSNGSSARVLRITEALAVSTVTTLTVPISELLVTPTRLVVVSSAAPAAVLSLPKAGGATTTLNKFGTGASINQVIASGENVYAASYQLGGTGSTVVSTLVIGADGSNPQTLPNTDVKRGLAPAVQSLSFGLESIYAVVLADGVTGVVSNAGATLRVVEGATRNTLLTYGSLPATPDGVLFIGTVDPLQYGQSGLWAYYSTTATTATGALTSTDLFLFKSDAAGLIRVTNFGAATPSQATRGQATAAAPALRKGARGVASY